MSAGKRGSDTGGAGAFWNDIKPDTESITSKASYKSSGSVFFYVLIIKTLG